MQTKTVPNGELFPVVIGLLNEGHEVTIPVKGYSMLPFICEKDTVVLEKAGNDLQVGDIVLFTLGSQYIIHRIVHIDGDQFTMMGDGNYKEKEQCMRSDIHGRVMYLLKDGTKKRECNNSFWQGMARIWKVLLPIRRYLLAIYKRLPWNRRWLKKVQ